MKKVLTTGVFLIASTLLGANATRVSFGHSVREGALLTEIKEKGIHRYAVSLFVGRTPTKTRRISRTQYLKHLKGITTFEKQASRVPACRRPVQIQQKGKDRSLCLQTSAGKEAFLAWYTGVLNTF